MHAWILQNGGELCAPLCAYRAAIAQATFGRAIRVAFLTPKGALIEMNSP
jgi:hypothetical protein